MLAKRIFDIVFTLPGVILLSPIFMVIAVWIKLDSPGPIFFRQTRVGKFGKLFFIYKFRTMYVDAESRGKQITVGNDSRITRSGGFLRKYKLDELAQLFNVIKGEMSLVGPRPEVPRYVAEYPKHVKEVVLSLSPGITDYASIEYRDENKVLSQADDPERAYIHEVLPVKLSYYVRYAKEHNIWLDFTLILRTFYAVFWRRVLKAKARMG